MIGVRAGYPPEFTKMVKRSLFWCFDAARAAVKRALDLGILSPKNDAPRIDANRWRAR
jgi:hypothetical protein